MAARPCRAAGRAGEGSVVAVAGKEVVHGPLRELPRRPKSRTLDEELSHDARPCDERVLELVLQADEGRTHPPRARVVGDLREQPLGHAQQRGEAARDEGSVARRELRGRELAQAVLVVALCLHELAAAEEHLARGLPVLLGFLVRRPLLVRVVLLERVVAVPEAEVRPRARR